MKKQHHAPHPAPAQETSPECNVARRSFLKGFGLAAGTATALPVLVTATRAQVPETADELVKSRYRDSEWVQRFYALNRL
ncbi:hypothetical protein [Telmatospirillum sp. J64-1]|uniref:hypothetical protein n=1 Tax=Telmatospirillum sp. J64-1 TaxID=2502183 RepID=UPI00115EFD7E|nr:hypothetical protein [Telmatospirillum sp. J64-1]